jgi:PhoPQ-activated pathogenicity-related protein
LQPIPSELDTFLKQPKIPLQLTELRRNASYANLRFESQDWKGTRWRHALVEFIPPNVRTTGDAILFITGDYSTNPFPRYIEAAKRARLPLYVLHQVPNQPLMDGLREDALIAATFLQYLQTGDGTWPLLFPMTLSAIRGMDAIQEHTRGKVKRFIVAGASKRGWTTWLVGAAQDPRVVGIAPMVIDILNMPAQLNHQLKMLGGLSDEINDYSSTGLTAILSTQTGQTLAKMVDPYSYLRRVTVPTLVIVGGNDPFWTVDAHNLYWPQLNEPKLMRVVPNVGHNLGDGREAFESLSLFANLVLGHVEGGLPKGIDSDTVQDPRLKQRQEWSAISDSYRFTQSQWQDAEVHKPNAEQKKASFREYRFEVGDQAGSFTSRVMVWPPLPK